MAEPDESCAMTAPESSWCDKSNTEAAMQLLSPLSSALMGVPDLYERATVMDE
jgi:hypothetical protein